MPCGQWGAEQTTDPPSNHWSDENQKNWEKSEHDLCCRLTAGETQRVRIVKRPALIQQTEFVEMPQASVHGIPAGWPPVSAVTI